MDKNPIKITSKGKVSIPLTRAQKVCFLHLIEHFLSELCYVKKHPLDGLMVSAKVQFAIISEIYTRHYSALNLVNEPCKLLLTMPQALTLWELASQDDVVANTPLMGLLLMHLHQKLS